MSSASGLRMVSPGLIAVHQTQPKDNVSKGLGTGKNRAEEQNRTTRYPHLGSYFFGCIFFIKCVCFQLKLNLIKLWWKVIFVCYLRGDTVS